MSLELPTVRRSTWIWLSVGIGLAALFYVLQPILFPFLFAAVLAYVFFPLVRWLDRRRLPRTVSVTLVLLLAFGVLVLLVLIVLPLIVRELTALADRAPDWIDTLDERVAPWINERLGTNLSFDLETVVATLRELLATSDGVGQRVLTSLKLGGLGLVGLLANIVLIPIVLFFMLRDGERFLERLEQFVPRRWHTGTMTFVRESDRMLGQYLHGQVLVLLVMSVFYTVGLWLTGLQAFLPIGIVTGLLTFIPYLGASVGFVLATLAAFMEFDDMTGVAWVWGVFFIGQAVEGNFVTPKLVGGAIGLHPLAVIFALLAFGQLFGFVGLLMALPASAVVAVAARMLREKYLVSEFYRAS